MFYKLWQVIFYLLVINNAYGQLKSQQSLIDIKIYGGQNGKLYTDNSNLITLISKDTVTNFQVKSSQGRVTQLDKYMFFVDSLIKGSTTITISKNLRGKTIPIKTITYNVVVPKAVTKYNSLRVSPEISLGGFTSGKIKVDSLKKIDSITINEDYRILEATFYIGQNDLQVTQIKSKYFDHHLKELWYRIMPNCTVSIDNILFMDKGGNRYVYPKRIAVIAGE